MSAFKEYEQSLSAGLDRLQDHFEGAAALSREDALALVTFMRATLASTFAAVTKKENLDDTRVRLAQAAASRDGLTRLLNRAAFEALFAEIFESKRNQRNPGMNPFVIAIFDLDHFKRVNDGQRQHAAGDEALKVFAGLLKKFIRAEDLVARYGGEEFAVCLRDAGGLRRFLKDMEGPYQFTHNEKTVKFTTSAGVLIVNEDILKEHPAVSAADLVAEADKRLYEAKERGRARAYLGRDKEGKDRVVSLVREGENVPSDSTPHISEPTL